MNTTKQRVTLTAGLAIAAMMAITPAVSAGPVATHVIDSMELGGSSACRVVTLRFQLPMQYLRHFPESHGDDLLVRVAPLESAQVDSDALSRREATRPDPAINTALDIATYEGDLRDGPIVRFQFNREVNFSVTQGADYRSLVITFADSEAGDGAPGCDDIMDFPPSEPESED